MGQPFFPSAGVSAGVADGLSSGSGVGVGVVLLRFDLLFGVAVGDGLGEDFFRFGEASGDGVGVGFFFRCLRVGVGDGSKTFLIFVPNDSGAENATSTAPKKITRIRNHFIYSTL